MNSDTLQPGQKIKPNVSNELAKQLIQQHYGYVVTRIKEQNSYDDNNYYVETATAGKFIFKVLNSMDTKKIGHVQAENACMAYLSSEKGIWCPIPEKNVHGQTYAIISVPNSNAADDAENNDGPSQQHAIRLLRFVDGILLNDIPITEKLLLETGAYVSQLGKYLAEFTHAGLAGHSGLWMLSSVPKVLQFLYVLQDQPAKVKLVEEIISAFQTRVESNYPNLQRGVVHGDLNEQNILVKRREGSDYEVYGIIDFGDLQNSFYIFELAIAATYMMIQCLHANIDPIQGSVTFLRGYEKHRTIPNNELDILRICIASRLCQSVVLGAYTYSQDPGNEYLLTTAKTGWHLLSLIWSDMSEEQLKSIWSTRLQPK